MPTKIYWIHTFDNAARIGITARPRGADWLEDEIASLKNHGVTVLISLLERHEIYELQLEQEEQICKSKKISFVHFPIPDRGIPDSKEQTDTLLNQLAARIEDKDSIVIHCRMGIGRSSIMAAAVLLKYNFRTADIVQKINSIRGLKVPDTDGQLLWLKKREEPDG